jgi:hypothetical protein
MGFVMAARIKRAVVPRAAVRSPSGSRGPTASVHSNVEPASDLNPPLKNTPSTTVIPQANNASLSRRAKTAARR